MFSTILKKIGQMDAKTIVIFILLALLAFFYVKGMFNPSDDNSDKISELEKINKQLEKDRDNLEDAYETTYEMYLNDSSELSELKKEFDLLEALLADKERELKKSRKELSEARKRAEETRKKIKELEETPIKRTGNDLIESIQEKTTK